MEFPMILEKDMMSSKQESRTWTFVVRSQVQRDEVVCVSGNVKSLGNWQPTDVVPMEQVQEGSSEDER